jgi:hypothetical protein
MPCPALPCLALLRHRRPTKPWQRADASSTALFCPKASARLGMQIPQQRRKPPQPHAMTRHSARHSRGWHAQNKHHSSPLTYLPSPNRNPQPVPASPGRQARRFQRAVRTRVAGPPPPPPCGAVRCGEATTHSPASQQCGVPSCGEEGGNNGSRGARYASQSKSGPLRTAAHHTAPLVPPLSPLSPSPVRNTTSFRPRGRQ